MDYFAIIIFILIIIFLYNCFNNKRIKLNNNLDNYNYIQEYLLQQDEDIEKMKNSSKPIIWIHINYEYNSRKWLNFGSRSSYDLNQPYMYLTIKSIINKCGDDFHICLIDDNSFHKLLPKWEIDMNIISNPINQYIRMLGLCKILYMYGGMIIPPSFLCLTNLKNIYYQNNNRLFVFEGINRTVTSNTLEFSPMIGFIGSLKNNSTLKELIEYMNIKISKDFTAENKFLGCFSNWCINKISTGEVLLIDGKLIGIKTKENNKINIDDLLSFDYIDFHNDLIGIYINSFDILNRIKYEWFSRMSAKQILESDLIISKYMVIANIPINNGDVLFESYKNNNEDKDDSSKWVGWWQVPSQISVYGLKPQPFATNLIKTEGPPERP
jgi:hypothetical protein